MEPAQRFMESWRLAHSTGYVNRLPAWRALQEQKQRNKLAEKFATAWPGFYGYDSPRANLVDALHHYNQRVAPLVPEPYDTFMNYCTDACLLK